MRVHKCNHRGERKYSYAGELELRDASKVVVKAPWTFDEMPLAYSRFSPGDIFTETFYFDRWHNIFEIAGKDATLKGWYANITRPTRLTGDDLEWDDLALDAWMSTDGHLLLLDEDEFEALVPSLTPVEAETARGAMQEVKRELRERWRSHANAQIAAQLQQRGWTVGTAESCTGGLIGDVLTNRAGSSAYFMGGVLSYSNDIKHRVLGVQSETLNAAGAVSEPCALEMARGVRKALGVDVGISATGIAGPDGGSTDKPVGLVYVGLSTPEVEFVSRNVWPHDRIGNKQATADEALRLLMAHLTRA
jgi:PncC family amidohydrolase